MHMLISIKSIIKLQYHPPTGFSTLLLYVACDFIFSSIYIIIFFKFQNKIKLNASGLTAEFDLIVFGLTGKPNPIALDVAAEPDLHDAAISFTIQILYIYNMIHNIINLYAWFLYNVFLTYL
jgi:hypothetical protein